jgi:putative transposase
VGRKARHPPGAYPAGHPQQNAYVERYNRTVRYDWLEHYLFESIAEVQEHATRWVWAIV